MAFSVSFNMNISRCLCLNVKTDSYITDTYMEIRHLVPIMIFQVVMLNCGRMCFGFSLWPQNENGCLQQVTEYFVLPWVQTVTAGKNLHLVTGLWSLITSRRAPILQSENICNQIIPTWLSNSSDCHPGDYYIWKSVDLETNKIPKMNRRKNNGKIYRYK